MTRSCIVYGLAASDRPLEVRYVGQTGAKLEYRLRDHLYRAEIGEKNHRACWVRSVVARGQSVLIVPLVENAKWAETEIEVIARLRASGADLVNATDGGDGVRNPSPAARAKISEAGKGRSPSERHREKAGSMMAERWKDPAWRQARAAHGMAQVRTPEAAAKRKLARAGFRHSVETKARLAEISSAHHAQPGVREEIARRAREAWAKPENRAKLCGENSSSAKLTKAAVIAIRLAYEAGGVTQQALADRYGVGLVTVNHIIKRRTWAHVA